MANPQTGSSKVMWLVGLLLVIVASLAAANVYLMFDKQAGHKPATRPAALVSPAPLFVKVAPFTVNLDSEHCGAVLLYIGMTVKVGDAATQDYLSDNMPQLRSRLLMLLSGQDSTALISSAGKQKLADDIAEMLSHSLAKPQPELAIDEVLFTEFIVQ